MKRRAMESAVVASRTGSPTRPKGASRRWSAAVSSVAVDSDTSTTLAYTSSRMRPVTTSADVQPRLAPLYSSRKAAIT